MDDGLFDIVIVGDFGKIELLRIFPRVYKGTHLSYPKIRLERGSASPSSLLKNSGCMLMANCWEKAPFPFKLSPLLLAWLFRHSLFPFANLYGVEGLN